MEPVVELERRFLLNSNINWILKFNKNKIEHIVQGYLFHNSSEQLRIRETNNLWYVLTHKKIITPEHRLETDTVVPIITGQTLLKASHKIVHKTRVYLQGKLCIDYFHLKNLYILEIEFEQGEEVIIPEELLALDPLIREISLDKNYSNYNLGF